MGVDITVHYASFAVLEGICDECEKPLDTDRDTIHISLDNRRWLRYHDVCAWTRASRIFGQLFT
jgi:hypothetical protein